MLQDLPLDKENKGSFRTSPLAARSEQASWQVEVPGRDWQSHSPEATCLGTGALSGPALPCLAWRLWVHASMLSSTILTAMGCLLALWLAMTSLQPARTQEDNSSVEEEDILVLNQHNFDRALKTYKLLLVEFCE